ncbi:hypothetical protein AB0912_15590 [Streptomyces sp. NPDC007084]|uniref:hypothetical protein n=1 Tax=Streptomyces sp. NPDC007084 TaxID=3154313 RepID=UPI0034523DFB
MADSQDEVIERLALGLSVTYSGLARVCLALPVPIALATGPGVSNLEAIPAVRRIMEVLRDQPMPEEQHGNLYSVCAYWLAAMDVFTVLVAAEFHAARAMSIEACLMMADGCLLDIAGWAASQDG